MTAMPIRATVLPTAIKTEENGNIPVHLLEPVDGRTQKVWLMASLPARGMRAMRAAIHARFGVWMTSVGRGRTFEEQHTAFVTRHRQVTQDVYNATKKIAGVANKRIWPDAKAYGYESIYWVLRPGFASAAVPGTSPHGWWCADDMALPDDADADTNPEGIGERPDILEWLYSHEHLYGFAHSLTSEPWHVQWISGDVVPPAVLAFELATDPAQPIHPLPSGDPDMARLIQPNDGDPAVFSVAGTLATWVHDEAALNTARVLGTVDATVHPVPRSTLAALTLVGSVPRYDFPPARATIAADFAEQVA